MAWAARRLTQRSAGAVAQVMPKSQLPGLMMATFLVQTLTAPALSKYAKGSLRRRNQMLLFGVLPMVAANAAFAFSPNSAGKGTDGPGTPRHARTAAHPWDCPFAGCPSRTGHHCRVAAPVTGE